jgi:hypothetical protein
MVGHVLGAGRFHSKIGQLWRRKTRLVVKVLGKSLETVVGEVLGIQVDAGFRCSAENKK